MERPTLGATSSSTSRSSWRRRAVAECRFPLIPPPDLGEDVRRQAELEQQKKERAKTTSSDEKFNVLFGKGGGTGQDTQQHTKNVGLEGSKTRDRAQLIDTLALGGSTSAEIKEPRLMKMVYGLCFLLWNEYGERQSADPRWCDAFAEAAARVGRRGFSGGVTGGGGTGGDSALTLLGGGLGVGGAGDGPPQRVCVLGLGSGGTALAAARAGATVLWLERIARFAELAEKLVERNGRALQPSGGQVVVRRVKQYSDAKMPPAPAPLAPPHPPSQQSPSPTARFDAVVTEEASDNLLGDGLLALARHAHAHLLRPGGVFVPSRARVFVALASLRVEEIAGFDLRAFNAFRSNSSVWVDLEHVWATDRFGRQHAQLLSEPAHVFDFDFSSGDALPPLSRTAEVDLVANAHGVVNCVTWWYEIDLGDGVTKHSLAPNREKPLPFESRARRQQLRYLCYERYVARGESLRLTASHDERSLSVDLPTDRTAEREGRLRHWPSVNLLAYHFAMIADEGRNGAFDGALKAAISGWKARHPGRKMRVLDIGSGSGLLAMMAARAGAEEVHSLEMVPALAHAARHIVAHNGYAERVTIHSIMSTDLDPHSLGGLFDLLVCEIVDDQLLGEGVLPTILDARRRLLVRDDPIIIPSGATVYTMPVEDRVNTPTSGARAGLALDDMNTFACDSPLSPRSHSGCKLQRKPKGAYTVLHPSIELFDFDFATGDLEGYMRGRQKDVPITIRKTGLLTGLVIHWTLRCDDTFHFHSGPENRDLVAWDQSVRLVPVEMRLAEGQTLVVRASHDHEACRVGLPQVHPSMVAGCVGHLELFDPRHAQEQLEQLRPPPAPALA